MSDVQGLSVHERIEKLFDWDEEGLTMGEQAATLGVSQSSIYYAPRPVSPETLDVMHRIDKIHTDWPTYGQRPIAVQLTRDLGKVVGRDWVCTLMQEMGIEAIYQKPHLSQNRKEHMRFPYLLKGVPFSYPNHIWSTDITYVKMKNGFVYVVAFLDWFSRYVLSWKMSTTLDIAFVLEATKEALERYGNPDYANSDQGSHFTSPQYVGLWDQDHTKMSMDGRGRCMDNILIERLWRSFKYEEVYLKDYTTAWEAEHSIGDYFRRYNMQRLHESLGYQTPYEVYYKK